MAFELISDFKPTGDQPTAIESLTQGLLKKKNHQVLLGVSEGAKTYSHYFT